MLFAVLGVFAISVVSLFATYEGTQGDDKRIALFFPLDYSYTDSFKAVINASGIPLSFGATSNIIIAEYTLATSEKFISESGALFSLNPTIPGICTSL